MKLGGGYGPGGKESGIYPSIILTTTMFTPTIYLSIETWVGTVGCVNRLCPRARSLVCLEGGSFITVNLR